MPRLRNLLVVDLEATCWEDSDGCSIFPDDQTQEVIEIGICHIDTVKLEIVHSESILVKPQDSSVSEFCTSLTGLTSEILERDGVCFGEALKRIRTIFGKRERAWASWGAWDHWMLSSQCDRLDEKFPFDAYHVNVAAEFTLNTGRSRVVSLMDALGFMGIDFEGEHHRGVDDAINTARLFIEMQRNIRGNVYG